MSQAEQIKRVPFVRTPAAPSVAHLMEKHLYCGAEGTLPYRLYLPADYTSSKKYPLILFFHGAGERGEDNELQLKIAIGQFFKDPASPVYGCIVAAPQCPEGEQWVSVPAWTATRYSTEEIPQSRPLSLACGLLDELLRTYSVDEDRIYPTGISMGAYATWDLLVRHTDRFAAAIPVCGGADYRHADRLVDVPIRTFHGLVDSVVPPDGTEQMVNTLLSLGAQKIHCTLYEGGDHGIWETAFSTEGLFAWLLSKRLSDRKKRN